MTKLEKLRKEYRETMLDLMLEDGTPEMQQALQNKLNRLQSEIQMEQIRSAKRGKDRYDKVCKNKR